MKRLLIIADHSFVVEAIRLALRQTAGFKVVGFIDGRRDASLAIRQAAPDVVLVDEMQQPAHALERLRETAAEAPNAKTLLLTLQMEESWQEEAFAAGAHAIVSKSVHPVSLGTLVREIANGNVVHSYRPPAPAAAQAEECPLTDRELEILKLVAEGLTNSRIARSLWVTEQTVKFHLSNTYRKLGVANRTEASRYAYMHDLVGPEPARLAS
jgi:DNA-binding NarL/FixJ family response regulator